MSDQEPPYHIGVAGEPWGEAERNKWLNEQLVKRSYKEQVLDLLSGVDQRFDLIKYGALQYDRERYPLYVAQSHQFDLTKPTTLVTGGVHGYETSGVQGALRFLLEDAKEFLDRFNVVVMPCISPWAYETTNRWNPKAVDPNRSFIENSPAEESGLVMRHISNLPTKIDVHVDLHETTDTDNTEFRPALSARDNVYHEFWEIPDGFYLVGDTSNPCPEFQKHIIDAVSKVTHIAPSDDGGRIIGEPIEQTGVINYATSELGLCTGFTKAKLNTTTEVYPDSPKVDEENCIRAQVVAVCAALEFAAEHI